MNYKMFLASGLFLWWAAPSAWADPVVVYDLQLTSSGQYDVQNGGSGTIAFDAADIASETPSPFIESYSFNDGSEQISGLGAPTSYATYDPAGNLLSTAVAFTGAHYSTPNFFFFGLNSTGNGYEGYELVPNGPGSDNLVTFDSGTYTLTPLAVPEPRPLLLTGIAGLLFGGYLWKKRQSLRLLGRLPLGPV